MALARTSSGMALLPSKSSLRTTRGCSCAASWTAAARNQAHATAATPLTEAPWPGNEGCGGARARLTTCFKLSSLTTLRLHVNVRGRSKPPCRDVLPHLPTDSRIHTTRRRASVALLALSLFGAAGCAVGEGTRPNGLSYFLTADPASLDPAASNDVQSGEMVALLFDNLVQFDVDAGLVPGLATRWEADPTGTVYTFHLRSNARFHDGRLVTASVVRASMLRALAPGSGAARVWPLLPIKGAREYAAGAATSVPGIVVPNDSTVVFTLS